MSNSVHGQKRRVLVIGWDGADWKVASPLIDAGKMPNLQSLIEGGVMGNISTLYPVLSPMLWTSIATGKRAHKHGIHGFAEPDANNNSVRPITNLGRKCKAIWNILNQNDKKCNIVGWWPSHPAEPINGVMVSNHFHSSPGQRKDSKWPMLSGTIHPPVLAKSLCKFRVHPYEIEPDHILPFIPDAAKIDQTKDKRILAVAKTLAECSSVHSVATGIMQHEPWDFMGIYYDAIDHFSHGFMKFHPPRESWVTEQEFDLYKGVVETAYRFHDLMLGVLLNLAGPDTTIVLLSDHGFHPDHLRPEMIGNEPAGPADEHRQFGMLVINGPGIKQDELVFGASLLDITPTILSLYGLPIGRDMDGKPLLSAFEDPLEPVFIESWELVDGNDGRHPPNFQVDPVDAHESLKQLVELGYIERPDDDQEKATRQTVRELRYNLARDYLDAQRLPEAIIELGQLWSEFPDESRFGVKLFGCYLTLGNLNNAETTLNRLVKEKRRYAQASATELKALKEKLGDIDPNEINQNEARQLVKLRARGSISNPNAFAYLRGSLLFAKGKFEDALKSLTLADKAQTYNQPSLILKKGQCYLGLRQWENAKSRFKEILAIDPSNADAYLGLAQSEMGMNRPQKAVEAASASIGLVYHNPKAHFVLGSTLLKTGRKTLAIDSLKLAIGQNNVFPDCHRLLSKIYRDEDQDAKADEHDRMAIAAGQRLANFKAGLPLPQDANVQFDVSIQRPIVLTEINGPSFDRDKTVIVVSGLPRSGTSMMMQMLQAGGVELLSDDIRNADSSNPKGYLEYEPVKSLRTNNTWVNKATGKAIKVVTQLLPNLPHNNRYLIINMTRSLAEILASQSKMLSRLDRTGSKIPERQLAETYRAQVEHVSKIVGRYENIAIANVDYSDAINRPLNLAKRINSLLGGILNESAMASVIDPSLKNEGMQNP